MNLMNTMMLSCVKATQLMEMREAMPLGFVQEVQLQMHIAMCSDCKNYMKQTAFINKLLQQNLNSMQPADTTELEQKIVGKIT